MPYNNNPIAPQAEITGTVNLPLARVKKIIHADDDLPNCSNNAAFAITVAAEQFLQYLVEQTHNVVKAERKPRRNLQYRDVANAIARHDNLEFLSDVVPKTIPMKVQKEKMARAAAAAPAVAEESGRAGVEPIELDPRSDHAGPGVMDIDAVAGTGVPTSGSSGINH